MNLLSNAIDALEELNRCESLSESDKIQKKITIHTKAIGADWIAIRIADNGVGITKDNQHKLFNSSFTTKPVGKGTGLGLSISYSIVVEKHRGKLYCHSKRGEGTEFVIEVPVKLSSSDESLNQESIQG